MSRPIRLVAIVVLNVIILATLIAGLELVSSRFARRAGDNIVAHYRLNHRAKPNSNYVHKEWVTQNPDFPEPYTHVYNRQGWIMDHDIDPAKPTQVYRIFYLGDSFTEGTLPMAQSPPAVVERTLNDLARGKSLHFEVINTGTLSYSPTIYYVLVRYVLMEYAPDLIVVNVDMTDDFDDWKYSQTLIRDAEGNPWAVPPRDIYDKFVDTAGGAIRANAWTHLELFLLQHSYTYNLIRRIAPRGRPPSTPNSPAPTGDTRLYQRWAWCQRDWDDFTVENVNRTLDLLRRLAMFAREHGVKIAFTSIPHYWQYAGNEEGQGEPRWSSRPHDEIGKVAKANDVPYLNSYEALKPLIVGTPQSRYYYRKDMHFNPRGYGLWAQAQVRFLTDRVNHLLPAVFYE